MNTKVANYTEAQTTELTNAYSAADSEESRTDIVEAFMASFGKTKRSIVGKLSSEKVYVKSEVAVKGCKAASKSKIVQLIAKECDLTEESIESLERATKSALRDILGAIRGFKNESES